LEPINCRALLEPLGCRGGKLMVQVTCGLQHNLQRQSPLLRVGQPKGRKGIFRRNQQLEKAGHPTITHPRLYADWFRQKRDLEPHLVSVQTTG